MIHIQINEISLLQLQAMAEIMIPQYFSADKFFQIFND
jgi:hypothetical protein